MTNDKIDIIALAKEARLSPALCFLEEDKLKCFAALHEAEIRKEYEAELKLAEQQVADLMADVNRLGKDKDSLTEQNAKLMDERDLWKKLAEKYYGQLTYPEQQELGTGALDAYFNKSLAALTPQPENREGE